MSVTNYTKYKGLDYLTQDSSESKKLFKGIVDVPAIGDVLTAVEGDVVTINAKIARVVEIPSLPNRNFYSTTFLVTDEKLTFKKNSR